MTQNKFYFIRNTVQTFTAILMYNVGNYIVLHHKSVNLWTRYDLIDIQEFSKFFPLNK